MGGLKSSPTEPLLGLLLAKIGSRLEIDCWVTAGVNPALAPRKHLIEKR